MRIASVGEVQKNFGKILREIHAGEEITITRRGKPVARLTALGPKSDIDWPDFYNDAIELKGKPVSEILIEDREDRL
jgi:prevent-host-death family protein